MKKVRILKEFRTFISRGTIVDVAIAVIMGSAFSKLVNSFVINLLSPCVSVILGHVKLTQHFFNYQGTEFHYGAFLQAALNFFVLTVVVFFLVKAINSLRETVTGKHIVIKKEPSEKELLKEIHEDLRTNVSAVTVKPASKEKGGNKSKKAPKRKRSISDEARR
jgi:large conductance mechanosensitive channel